MARRQTLRGKYMAALESTSNEGTPHISHVGRAEGDGEFTFTFSHELLPPPSQLQIQLIPQDFTSYPAENSFMAFADTAINLPVTFTQILEGFVVSSRGLQVDQALRYLSQSLATALEGSSTSTAASQDDGDLAMTDIENEEQDLSESDDGMDFLSDDDSDGLFGLDEGPGQQQSSSGGDPVSPEIQSRVHQDLRAARKNGFKVSKLCGFDDPAGSHILSISLRVDKLCLSTETRDAWNIRLEDFVVLLIKYNNKYMTVEDVMDRPANTLANNNIQFRLRKCGKYKPSVQEALKLFRLQDAATEYDNLDTKSDDLELFSIGRSIDTFMDSEFIPLMKLKAQKGYSWDTTKRCYAEMAMTAHHGASPHSWGTFSGMPKESDAGMQKESDADKDEDGIKLPGFLTRDTLASTGEISLPLVAAQFAMRYLVRCTEYCMVCHQKVEGNFEALKPYVCGNALCLFQYMSMGFGPSIDHEIIHQPNVVDLLISFCFAGLTTGVGHFRSGDTGTREFGIREFPTGLNLQVPNIRHPSVVDLYSQRPAYASMPPLPMPTASAVIPAATTATPTATTDTSTTTGATPLKQPVEIAGATFTNAISGLLDCLNETFQVKDLIDTDSLGVGKWVAIASHNPLQSNAVIYHGRIDQIHGAMIHLRVVSAHLYPELTWVDSSSAEFSATHPVSAHMVLYDLNLDDLEPTDKAVSMMILLATIPSVEKMKSYLTANPSRQIEKWDKLTPAALKLLRWIVASNRSFIVQVEDDKDSISGVSDCFQFRFAQGSPEKEMRFREALKEVTTPTRTLLAWHGSNLANWHSIIRTGLNFDRILNGRAYGNGVYFSRSYDYSLGYASTTGRGWPNSTLQVQSAMSLNELVNLPSQFQHAKDEFFVVAQVHWIQCRYLFVKPRPTSPQVEVPAVPSRESRQDPEFIQDAVYPATGPSKRKLFIPQDAIPSARIGGDDKKSNALVMESASGHSGLSEDEDEDDKFVDSEDEDKAIMPNASYDETKTDFRPGTLDYSTLPKLNPPSSVTGSAQKTLSREIRRLQEVQKQTPLHELGWFVDFDNTTNLFHWIVELHSFDPSLPLAQDMKNARITSVILELRFGSNYPLSPPFVRVIRPRFLPFMAGGGGHVTAGGAMCMELLTSTGWSCVNSIESVLLQVRMALCSTDPKPARLESIGLPSIGRANRMDYGIVEAVDAYRRAATTHRWRIPEDLATTTEEMIPVTPMPPPELTYPPDRY